MEHLRELGCDVDLGTLSVSGQTIRVTCPVDRANLVLTELREAGMQVQVLEDHIAAM
jgi:hypothetical protein